MPNSTCSRGLCWPASALALLLTIVAATATQILAADAPAAEKPNSPTPRIVLPRDCYAVVGQQMSIYFQNVVPAKTAADSFHVECKIGKADGKRWAVTPVAADAGDHPLSVTLRSGKGEIVGQAETTVHVCRATAGEKSKISLLIIGDSLTHATAYPNEIARLLSQPGNPQWTMLGTHRPASANKGVAHEGYGGWTWQRFASKYEPNPDGTYRKRSSPFVFLGENDKPELNVSRYIKQSCENRPPDFVIIMLGINDCFAAKSDDPKQIDQRIDGMFAHASVLLRAIRAAAPQTQIGVCLTTPGNSRDGAYEANYKGRYTRSGWDLIQRRLVHRQLGHFSDREAERMFIVPTELNLDIVAGYPDNNAVHPNALGYRQIGGSIYAWLKWQMAQR